MNPARRKWSLASVAQVREELQQPNAAAPEPQAEDWRFHDAAAVLSWFELHPTLHPVGRDAAADSAALTRLVGDCIGTSDSNGRRRFTLKNEIRKQALARLGSWDAIRAALAANTTRPEDDLQSSFEAVVHGRAKPLTGQSLGELYATLQVLDWLPSPLTGDPALPRQEEVRRRIEWAALRAPFEALANLNFRGRAAELATLRDYVGVRAPSSVSARLTRVFRDVLSLRERRPLVIFGPGGMGKSTLLSRFILEHTADSGPRLPFIYLDCDRPGLVPDEPLTLLLEGVRQLGVQFPAFSRAAEDWVARWQREAAVSGNDAVESTKLTVRGRGELIESCRIFIDDLELGDTPLLLVVDTFEEVQYRGRAYVHELWRLLAELQRLVPRLRTVVAGRARVDEPCEELPLDSLDAESAASFLEANGISDPEVAKAVARQVRRNPLSLKLAAQVLRHETPKGRRIEDLESGGVFKKLDDNRIQGELFRRILSHVEREDVRKLAHPGLALRRITPEIIEQVLAGPCGVAITSSEQAQDLFDALRREVSLVTTEASGREVRHRQDVRRVMLDLLRKAEPAAVRTIEENAVRYYEQQGAGLPGRAEEIYHRLGLGQDEATLLTRWETGVEAHLRGAVEDFSGATQALLAKLVGMDLVDARHEDLGDAAWEAVALKQAGDLLDLGRPEEALGLLRSRRTRLAGGALRALEAQSLARLGRMREARIAALDAVGHELSSRQGLDLHRIIAQADDILGTPLSEADPVGLYQALSQALPLELGVLELGAQWSRLLRRNAASPAAHTAALESLESAIGDSIEHLPDDVLGGAPWLLRKLQEDGLVRGPGQLLRIQGLTRGPSAPQSPFNASGSVPAPLVWSSLTVGQRQELAAALCEQFRTKSELETLVRSMRAPDLVWAADLGLPLRAAVLQIVTWAESNGRVGDLIAAAQALRPTESAVGTVAATLEKVNYAPSSPVATVLVDGARPFAGRERLRQFVAGIGRSEAPCVLLVNGPRHSGKSYSVALLAYVARNLQQFDFTAINCLEKSTIHDIAHAMASQGGWSAESMPTKHVSGPGPAQQLTQWILFQAGTRRKPLLFAIDNEGSWSKEVVEFLSVLVEHVAKAASPVLYLALLGFPRVLESLGSPTDRIMTEQLAPLNRADVDLFFTTLVPTRPVDDPSLINVKNAAAALVDDQQPDAQSKLSDFLGRAARDLLP